MERAGGQWEREGLWLEVAWGSGRAEKDDDDVDAEGRKAERERGRSLARDFARFSRGFRPNCEAGGGAPPNPRVSLDRSYQFGSVRFGWGDWLASDGGGID